MIHSLGRQTVWVTVGGLKYLPQGFSLEKLEVTDLLPQKQNTLAQEEHRIP